MKKNIVLALLIFPCLLSAQNFQISPGDTLHSVSIAPNGMTTFRIYAPEAKEVKIGGTDIPESFRGKPMVQQASGVWEVTAGPLVPGAYRYTFTIDKVSTMDPRNPSVSESNANSWSLIYVPGADFMDTKNVPHGAIAEITYYSHSLHRFRRMHVYTPPGYESGSEKFPVLYLLHGAFDSDDSWSTVGRAGFIIDNLLAEGNAVPMVVVMPAGHTGPFVFGAPPADPARDEFTEDFLNDIKPSIEKNYRVHTDRKYRAIAGLSMGGMQTLNIAIPHLDEYSSFGVFSSGIFELGGMNFMKDPGRLTWEERNTALLDNKDLKKGLTHVWFATGKEDFLLNISQKTVDLLKKHGFDVEFHQSGGGHTWANWREYLNSFVPLLFHGTNPK